MRGGGDRRPVTPTAAALLRAAGTAPRRGAAHGTARRQLRGRNPPCWPTAPTSRWPRWDDPVASPDQQIVLSTQPGRRDRRTPRPRHPARPRRRRRRRVGDARRHEEGPPGPRPARTWPRSTWSTSSRTSCSAETGTLGLRRTAVEKVALPRSVRTVELYGQSVRMKQGPGGVKPEYDDLARLAALTGKPLRILTREALDALTIDMTVIDAHHHLWDLTSRRARLAQRPPRLRRPPARLLLPPTTPRPPRRPGSAARSWCRCWPTPRRRATSWRWPPGRRPSRLSSRWADLTRPDLARGARRAARLTRRRAAARHPPPGPARARPRLAEPGRRARACATWGRPTHLRPAR